jgi:hypothetical protein
MLRLTALGYRGPSEADGDRKFYLWGQDTEDLLQSLENAWYEFGPVIVPETMKSSEELNKRKCYLMQEKHCKNLNIE